MKPWSAVGLWAVNGHTYQCVMVSRDRHSGIQPLPGLIRNVRRTCWLKEWVLESDLLLNPGFTTF